MASGPAAAAAAADDGDGISETRRTPELKVYSRRRRGKNTPAADAQNPQPSSRETLATTTTTGDVDSSLQQPPPPPPSPPERHQFQRSASSGNEASSLNRHEPEATPDPKGSAPHQQNGHVAVEDAKRSQGEARDLRRMLTAQLDQVRDLLKRLETREHQLSAIPSAGGGGSGVGAAPSQLSVNHVNTPVASKRESVFSEAISATPAPLRPQLNILVPPGVGSRNSLGTSTIEREKRTPKANQYFRSSDFILGKEKFPPSVSQKKSKSSKSRKHSTVESDYRASANKKIYANAFRSCRTLLDKLMKHNFGWVFNKPVDVEGLGLYDYFSIIKHPMDLGTVQSRVASNFYESPLEFAADVRRTFQNAMLYNPKGQDVHVMAEQLLNVFEERWSLIETEFTEHLHQLHLFSMRNPPSLDMRTLEMSSSTVQPMEIDMRPVVQPMEIDMRPEQNQTQHFGRPTALKKPKANDINKRDMTFREKQTLRRHLESLPPEKLETVVQIIKKRNSVLNLHDDEIEVDIDCVDAETLWELDRFVTNYKKTLSKHKRKAELAMLARAEAERHNRERLNGEDPYPVVAEVPEQVKNAVDQNKVAAPLTEAGANNGNDESGSSGSSRSSSDSGSSDSDSDTESSSSYESDAAHSPGN
ncbi:transcription factor GTE4-like [Musa acuminata AAA Group]|uniref:transcription factor GTE4-like n=1 Tax=Musa acuminata AAA Group TaxID=214697 RepID=UPI0031D76A72